jgi:hypothetical protein
MVPLQGLNRLHLQSWGLDVLTEVVVKSRAEYFTAQQQQKTQI